MIEHRSAVAARARGEPEPSAIDAMRSLSSSRRRHRESAAVRYERERIDAWIRESPHRLSARLLFAVVVSRSSRGRIGRKCRTARRGRVFIGLVTPNGVLSGKRRRGRRWGSRAEPFRNERSRRMRRRALDDHCRWQDHRTRGQRRAFEQGLKCWQRFDKASDSADFFRSTTGWRAADVLLHEAIGRPDPRRPDRETET